MTCGNDTDCVSRARYERERLARLEAERLLEVKSRSLFEANLRLSEETHRLEIAVADRVQELQLAYDLAEAASSAKSAFLANMSHEIRTPLNGVIGLAGALTRTTLSAQQQEMVSLIRTSGETLVRLLSDILDVTKIEAGKIDIQAGSFDLQEAVNTAAEIMRVRADDKGIGFEVIFGHQARGLFEGDAVRVRQIISNLASNAVKFTGVGGVTVLVDVIDRVSGPSEVIIQVEDTGIGFDEEAGRRLFGRFEQADGSITRNYGGTGLGLSICRSLAELMGGTISAASTPGAGSLFKVVLPLERTVPLADFDHRSTDVGNQSTNYVDLGLDHVGQTRVLLVEDHPTNQRVVSLILEPYGVSLTIANNGQEALDAFSKSAFDVILMDMQMPVMDGISATRAIRTLEKANRLPRTPIAMLSANAMDEHLAQAVLAGCDSHIAKPTTPEGLIHGLQLLLAIGANVQSEQPETAVA